MKKNWIDFCENEISFFNEKNWIKFPCNLNWIELKPNYPLNQISTQFLLVNEFQFNSYWIQPLD